MRFEGSECEDAVEAKTCSPSNSILAPGFLLVSGYSLVRSRCGSRSFQQSNNTTNRVRCAFFDTTMRSTVMKIEAFDFTREHPSLSSVQGVSTTVRYFREPPSPVFQFCFSIVVPSCEPPLGAANNDTPHSLFDQHNSSSHEGHRFHRHRRSAACTGAGFRCLVVFVCWCPAATGCAEHVPTVAGEIPFLLRVAPLALVHC